MTIYRLYTNYRSHDLSSIPDAPREGRPSRLSSEQKAELKDMILNKTPTEVGFPANFNWTAKLIQEYILRAYKLPV
ncbi:helix-turn-helix domain-containing protein [Fusibacter sp. JL298sf-3]